MHAVDPIHYIEEWRDVLEWKGFYQVSNLGRLRRIAPGNRTRPGRLLKLNPNKKGYLSTRFYRNGKGSTVHVHRLVARTFLGKPPDCRPLVHYLDGDPANNRVDNLVYASQAQISEKQRAGENIKCEQCAKRFYVSPCHLTKKHRTRFCSKECADKAQKQADPQICEECGVEFYVPPAELKKGNGRFCSRRCYTQSKKSELRKCEVCGATIHVTRSKCQNNGGRFCSKRCFGLGITGKNHPGWRGGVSFDPYPEEFNNRFKQMIRQRDQETCAICGGVGRCVHHIDYMKHNTDPVNCVTLCRSCHSRTNYNRPYWIRLLQSRTEVQHE